jgi:uridine phosphorylase
MGAPATVAGMEEMIACGARAFIGLGWAGSLQPGAAIGSALIPTSCVRDDGTTPHYCQDDRLLVPDPDLAERLYNTAAEHGLPCQRGPHWTTDAPYRELLSTIETHRTAGVLGVDMETAAMYALGVYRQVAVCNLLVVSDEVWRAWRSAAYTSAIREATLRAEAAVFEVLEGMG